MPTREDLEQAGVDPSLFDGEEKEGDAAAYAKQKMRERVQALCDHDDLERTATGVCCRKCKAEMPEEEVASEAPDATADPPLEGAPFTRPLYKPHGGMVHVAAAASDITAPLRQGLDAQLAAFAAEALAESKTFEQALQRKLVMMQEVVKVRTTILNTIYNLALTKSLPENWVLFRDTSGNETAHLKGPGALKIAPFVGAKIFNFRNREGHRIHEPQIYQETDKTTVAYLSYDGSLSFPFEQTFESLRFERNSSEDFVGRKTHYDSDGKVKGKPVPASVTRKDLVDSTYTGAVAKLLRIGLGLSRVPLSEFRDLGWNDEHIKRMAKGHGYSSSERTGGPQTEGARPKGGISTAQVKKFWAVVAEAAKRSGTPKADLVASVLGPYKLDGDHVDELTNAQFDAVLKALAKVGA